MYAVTNYWEKMDAKLEVQQGKNLVDAAKETGVQQFIWSSLLNINKRECFTSACACGLEYYGYHVC